MFEWEEELILSQAARGRKCEVCWLVALNFPGKFFFNE